MLNFERIVDSVTPDQRVTFYIERHCRKIGEAIRTLDARAHWSPDGAMFYRGLKEHAERLVEGGRLDS
jgi:hypothetical protein